MYQKSFPSLTLGFSKLQLGGFAVLQLTFDTAKQEV